MNTGGPAGQYPNIEEQAWAGTSVTLTGSLAVQETATVAFAEVDRVATSTQVEWPERPGFSKLVRFVVRAPLERKNRVTIRPAPMTPMAVPMKTSPGRTIGRKGALPIELRGPTSPMRGE